MGLSTFCDLKFSLTSRHLKCHCFPKKRNILWFIFSCNIVLKKNRITFEVLRSSVDTQNSFFCSHTNSLQETGCKLLFSSWTYFLQLLLELMRPRNVCVYRLAQDTLSQKKMFTPNGNSMTYTYSSCSLKSSNEEKFWVLVIFDWILILSTVTLKFSRLLSLQFSAKNSAILVGRIFLFFSSKELWEMSDLSQTG